MTFSTHLHCKDFLLLYLFRMYIFLGGVHVCFNALYFSYIVHVNMIA